MKNIDTQRIDSSLPRLLNEAELADMRKMSMERHGLGVYQYTLDGVITYIDRITIEIFDLSETYPDPAMAIGKRLDELIVYVAPQGRVRKQLQEDGHFYGNTYHYKTLKGDDRWGIHDAYKVNHPETSEELVHIVFKDITEIKKAELAQKSLQEQLYQAQKMEAIGLLAGGVAHDFNNILQVIMGFGEIANDYVKENVMQQEAISQVLKAGERAKSLVAQLLDYSRQQVLEMKVLDLNAAVEDLLTMMRRVIGEHIELSFIHAEPTSMIKADAAKIGQILTNLCVNARDAMPEGGCITIRTDNVQFDEAYCRSHSWASPGRYVQLSVVDCGVGMDEYTQSRIFEPFFTTKEVGAGSGLGLSTVYGLVEQHGGVLQVSSQVGQGSTFTIYLPASDDALVERLAESGTSFADGRETILLAEDNDAVRRLSRLLLEQAGYSVIEAEDGEAAIEQFECYQGQIDLLLFDVIMPKLGGREAFEQIRARQPDIKALFASGYNLSAVHGGCALGLGAALIKKPVSRDELLRSVRAVLDGAS